MVEQHVKSSEKEKNKPENLKQNPFPLGFKKPGRAF